MVRSKASPLLVPANALVIDQTGTHVVIVDPEKRIVFRQVKLGAILDEKSKFGRYRLK
jgi:hypothetical protein